MAGRVAIVAVATAVAAYGLLSRSVSVQPSRKLTAQQTQASSTPVHTSAPVRLPPPVPAPVPAPISASASMPLESPTGAVGSGALVRQLVGYTSRQMPGTVIIDTGNTFLYFVLNGRQAIRYAIGVGREGFTWSGEQTVARKAEWPDWHPPAEMVSRQPYLPRFMAGGPGNPLGARAMYLGETEYRIHGTNNPTTIGKRVSSGCIRLTNDDVVHLYDRVKVGAKVIVLPASQSKPLFAVNAQMPSSEPQIAEPR